MSNYIFLGIISFWTTESFDKSNTIENQWSKTNGRRMPVPFNSTMAWNWYCDPDHLYDADVDKTVLNSMFDQRV